MNPFKNLTFLLFALVALAQSQRVDARDVRLRLLAFDAETVPGECFAFDPSAPAPVPGIATPIKSYLNHEASILQLAGNEIVFSKSSKLEDVKKPELQLAKVTLPKSGSQFILVFLPITKETFRILPLSDAVKDFPLGSYRIISLSRMPIKLTLEDKPYEFKPGDSTLIEDPPVQANNHSAMYCFAKVDGKWQRIASGLWPHPGKKRSVEVFFDNPQTQQTELRDFKDISPPRNDVETPAPVPAPANP